MPRNRAFLFATETRPTGRTVYLPVPFRLILLYTISHPLYLLLTTPLFSLGEHPLPRLHPPDENFRYIRSFHPSALFLEYSPSAERLYSPSIPT